MRLVICPGIHNPNLTNAFLGGLWESWGSEIGGGPATPMSIFPTDRFPAYSSIDILRFVCSLVPTHEPLIWIGFSAGVVGALGAAWGWQTLGGQVKALIALDGWGMPLGGNFPIHRLSHDYFTHWSSALLGKGHESFYADPPVEHLELWRSPQQAKGWQLETDPQGKTQRPTTAATFLVNLLKRYGVQSLD